MHAVQPPARSFIDSECAQLRNLSHHGTCRRVGQKLGSKRPKRKEGEQYLKDLRMLMLQCIKKPQKGRNSNYAADPTIRIPNHPSEAPQAVTQS